MELVSRQVWVHLPITKQVILRTDNAANNSNNLVSSIAPFNFKKYAIILRRSLHSETKDGKEPANVYFATVLRIVDRYIESLELDVETPGDVVRALNHDDGMAASIAELYDVNFTGEQYKLWGEALNKDGALAHFRRVNEISYDWKDYSRT